MMITVSNENLVHCWFSDKHDGTAKTNLFSSPAYVVAEDGYMFDKPLSSHFTVSADGKYQTFATDWIEPSRLFNPHIEAIKFVQHDYVNLDNSNMVDCSFKSLSGDTITKVILGEQFLIVSDSQALLFKEDYHIIIDGVDITGTLSSDKETLTFNSNDFKVDYVFAPSLTPHELVVLHNDNLVHCSFENDIVEKGTDIVVLADTGYYFTDDYDDWVNGQHIVGTRTDNNTKMTIPSDNLYIDFTPDISANLLVIVKPDVSLMNVYQVTKKELVDLINEYIVTSSGDSVMSVQLTTFVNKFYIIPFKIPDTIKGSSEKMVIGNQISNVDGLPLTTHVVDYDLGTITIPKTYNNVYDFKNTTCALYVPYLSDSIKIEPYQVIGTNIKIVYRVDLISGDTVIIVYDSNDKIISITDVTLVYTLPLLYKQYEVYGEYSGYIDNSITKPYIQVSRNTPYIDEVIPYGKDLDKVDYIKNFKGYTQFENEFLNVKCTSTEIQLIKSLLSSGVVIE